MRSLARVAAAAVVLLCCSAAAGVHAGQAAWTRGAQVSANADGSVTYLATPARVPTTPLPAAYMVVWELAGKSPADVDRIEALSARQTALTAACPQFVANQLDGWTETDPRTAAKARVVQVVERLLGIALASPFRDRDLGKSPANAMAKFLTQLRLMVDGVKCLHNAGWVHRALTADAWVTNGAGDQLKLTAASLVHAMDRAAVASWATNKALPSTTAMVSAHVQLTLQPAGAFTPAGVPQPLTAFWWEMRRLWDSQAVGMAALGLYYGQKSGREVLAAIGPAPNVIGTQASDLPLYIRSKLAGWDAASAKLATTWLPNAPPMAAPLSALLRELVTEKRGVWQVDTARLPWAPRADVRWALALKPAAVAGAVQVQWVAPAGGLDQARVLPPAIMPPPTGSALLRGHRRQKALQP